NAMEAAGYTNIEYHRKSLPEAELRQQLRSAHFVGIRSRTQLTAAVLAGADRLIGIGCFCIGTNQVDLDAATKPGIAVFNAPYSTTRIVAQLLLVQAILLLRGIPDKYALPHRGIWKKPAEDAHEIRVKTLGIV